MNWLSRERYEPEILPGRRSSPPRSSWARSLRPCTPAARRGDEINLTQLLNEVTAQQATIADNQAKIDAKLATIAENIRQARIFAGRGR